MAVLLIERVFYARISFQSVADLCFSDVNATWRILKDAGGGVGGGWGGELNRLQSRSELKK